jgi:hypothetical protein
MKAVTFFALAAINGKLSGAMWSVVTSGCEHRAHYGLIDLSANFPSKGPHTAVEFAQKHAGITGRQRERQVKLLDQARRTRRRSL